MKKEIAIFLFASFVSIVLALGAFYFFVPALFGRAADLEVVQLDTKLPPFYAGVFRSSDARETKFLLNDPVTGVRAKPLLPAMHGIGPHDLLGFRNQVIPLRPDLVAIGDSQTYGNNALQSQTWPSVLQEQLNLSIYSMATGSWSALQYLEMAKRAVFLQPQAVVIALYTGNDAHETFRMAYENSYWKDFRLSPGLKTSDLPSLEVDSEWQVALKDNVEITFTPQRRHVSLKRDNAAIQAGFAAIRLAVLKAREILDAAGIDLFVTIVPTKELAYLSRLESENISMREDYQQLVQDEVYWIGELRNYFSRHQITYVDIIQALQDSIQNGNEYYPASENGHPLAPGYAVVGRSLAKFLAEKVFRIEEGLYKVTISEDEIWYFLVKDGKRYKLFNQDAVKSTEYDISRAQEVSLARLANFPLMPFSVFTDLKQQ